MEALLSRTLSENELRDISSIGLAHIGDAVYEILVRSDLITGGGTTASHLHQETTARVCAPAQAKAAEKLLPILSEDEAAVYRRGRNAGVHNVPKNATHAQYSRATGLEALFGYLYLSGRTDRLKELFSMIMEEQHAT